jgi:hypothetical protein
MPVVKHLLCPERVRHIPEHFSWIDHRLVRQKHLVKCGPWAWTLYLFLVTVGDSHGLSFYADTTIAKLLDADPAVLDRARHQLIMAGMIAYQNPLYQVLDLADNTLSFKVGPTTTPFVPAVRNSSGQPEVMGNILRRILEQQP